MNATVMMAILCLLLIQQKVTTNVLQFVNPVRRPQRLLLILVDVMSVLRLQQLMLQQIINGAQKNVIQRLQHQTQLLMNATVMMAILCLLLIQQKITTNVLRFVNPVRRPQILLLILVDVMPVLRLQQLMLQQIINGAQKNVIQRLQHQTQLLMNATVMMAILCLLLTQLQKTTNVLQFVIPILRPQAVLILVNVMVTQIWQLMKQETNIIAV